MFATKKKFFVIYFCGIRANQHLKITTNSGVATRRDREGYFLPIIF
jgi:hypothetical protein